MTPSKGMAPGRSLSGDIDVPSADGLILKGRCWRRPARRGVVVISHGYGEHGGAYGRVAETLA